MLELAVYAFGVGLAFNAHPGPVLAETIRRGKVGGFAPALGVQLGSLVGDAVWALIGLAGLSALLEVSHARLPIAIAGSALLVWLGVAAIRAFLKGAEPAGDAPPRSDSRKAWLAGAGMSLGNPLNIVYWSGAAGSSTSLVGAQLSRGDLLVFFCGFMAASCLWCLFCAFVVARALRLVPSGALWLIDGVCGLALVAFGLVTLGQNLR